MGEEYRKKIEQDMERFKEFERESKTKPHSKEGLSKGPTMDPEEAKKEEHREWMGDFISTLQQQLDEVDTSIESERRKKKPNEASITQWQAVQESHRWHVLKLEQLLRKLTNDGLDYEALSDLQEMVNFYVHENSQLADEFQTYDTIYDDFHLE